MTVLRGVAVVVAVASTICCAGSESGPPVHQPVRPSAAASAVPVPTGSPYEPRCLATSEPEGVADGLLHMLASADQRDAQFALDSLVLVRGEALPFLLCEIENDRPMQVRRLYTLNRVPHLAAVPELVAHHEATTIGEAVGLVVGMPGKGGASCGGKTRAERAACAAAWRAYLGKRGGRS